MKPKSIQDLCMWLNLPDRKVSEYPKHYTASEVIEFQKKYDRLFAERLADSKYAHLIDKRTNVRKKMTVTLRERKYLVKVNGFKYWSSELVNMETQKVEVMGLYNAQSESYVRSSKYDPLGIDLQLEEDKIGIWVTDTLSNRYIIPIEYIEELYEEAYKCHEQYWICDGSGDIIKGHRWEVPIFTISGSRGGRYCSSWVATNCQECSDCGELFWKRDLKQWTPEGAEEPIYTCHDCLVKRGVRFCHDCGAVVEKNSLFMNYCIEHGNLGIKRAMDREFINDYHNFSYFKKHLLPEDNKDSLLLGVELEVDQEEDEDRPQYDTLLEMRKMPCVADFQNDGSLEGGFEMITHPCTHGYHKKYLSAIVKEMLWHWNDDDYSDSCGVHIHVGREQLDEEIFRRIDYFMHKHKTGVTRLANRTSSRWARFAKDIDSTDWESFGMQHEERYEAMNFRNEHTVEFRIFAQPYNSSQMMTYIDFVDAVCMFNKLTTKKLLVDSSPHTSWKLFQFFVNEHKNKYNYLCKHDSILIS